MQKELLRKKMQKNFFKMIIVPFFSLTIIFALLFISFRLYMASQKEALAIKDAKHILSFVLESQKLKLENEFNKIETYAIILQKEYEHLFRYHPTQPSTQEINAILKTLLETNPFIYKINFIHKDKTETSYSSNKTVTSHSIKFTHYKKNFKTSISNSVLWEEPFFNKKLQSWMISAIIPVYLKRNLEAIVEIEITLKNLMQQLLAIDLPYKTKILLINKQGKITAVDQALQKQFPIHTNILKSNNIILQNITKNLSQHNNNIFPYNNTTYLTLTKVITPIHSHIILLTTIKDIEEKMNNLTNTSTQLIILMILIFASVLLTFYFLAKLQFKKISLAIVNPILSLANISKNIEKYKGNIPQPQTQILEIDTLSQNFKTMVTHLYEKDKQLNNFNTQLIQEVQKATKDLQEKNKTINIIFDTLMEAVVLWDSQHKLIKANKVAIEMFRFNDEEDILGANLLEYVVDSEKEKAKKFLAKTKATPYEIQLLRKDKTKFTALVQGQDIYINGIKHRLSTTIDITELKNQEKQLLQQSKQAQMGEMINMIAHQWRQPLNAISAAAIRLSMLSSMQALTDEKTQEASKSIQEQCQKMSKTIDTFLNFARPSQKKELFNLQDTFNAVMDLMLTQLKNLNIEIEINLEDNLQLYGFADQLEQVIINILANARDAFDEIEQEEKKITITALQKDNQINICIEDNAGGITPNVVNKIFNPYFTTKEQGKGTGIGLYMSLEIMRKSFNGNLIYKPRESGSCFFLICKEEKIDATTK